MILDFVYSCESPMYVFVFFCIIIFVRGLCGEDVIDLYVSADLKIYRVYLIEDTYFLFFLSKR